MKESKIETSTDTEDLANGQVGASGKKIVLTLVFDDVTATNFTTLQGYENALTAIFFKIYGIKNTQTLVVLNAIPIVELQANEVGKNWKRVLKATGYADTEANIFTLTP